MDVSEYDKGRGKVKVRARIESKGEKTIVIREIPWSTTTESLIASIETAAQKGRVKISGIEDFTTDKVEIELSLARGVYADEVIPQLYAYTDCEVTLQSSLLVIRDQKPVELTDERGPRGRDRPAARSRSRPSSSSTSRSSSTASTG